MGTYLYSHRRTLIHTLRSYRCTAYYTSYVALQSLTMVSTPALLTLDQYGTFYFCVMQALDAHIVANSSNILRLHVLGRLYPNPCQVKSDAVGVATSLLSGVFFHACLKMKKKQTVGCVLLEHPSL